MNRNALKELLREEVAGYCVCQKLRSASRLVTRRYDQALKQAPINGGQFTMLVVIFVVSSETLTEVARSINMERSTFIRNLRPLERDGFVSLSGTGQGTAHSVELTDKGVNLIEEVLPNWREAQRKLKAELGDEMWNSVQQSLSHVNAMTN